MKTRRLISMLLSVLMMFMMFPVSTFAEETTEEAVPSLSASIPAENPSAAESDFVFDAETGTITGYRGGGGNVEIPSAINGIPVVAIGSGVFYRSDTIANVTFPESVTLIGDSASYNCSLLTSVTILGCGVSIGITAFSGCVKLNSVQILGSVTSIGDQAFEKYYNINHLTFPYGLTTIGYGAFFPA